MQKTCGEQDETLRSQKGKGEKGGRKDNLGRREEGEERNLLAGKGTDEGLGGDVCSHETEGSSKKESDPLLLRVRKNKGKGRQLSV